MSTRSYRLTVLGCALAWLLLGLHLPTAHELLDHGQLPPPAVLAASVVLAVAGVAALWALLRAPVARR
jgi:hypothetical protein